MPRGRRLGMGFFRLLLCPGRVFFPDLFSNDKTFYDNLPSLVICGLSLCYRQGETIAD